MHVSHGPVGGTISILGSKLLYCCSLVLTESLEDVQLLFDIVHEVAIRNLEAHTRHPLVDSMTRRQTVLIVSLGRAEVRDLES